MPLLPMPREEVDPEVRPRWDEWHNDFLELDVEPGVAWRAVAAPAGCA